MARGAHGRGHGGKPCLRGLRITVYEILDGLAGDVAG